LQRNCPELPGYDSGIFKPKLAELLSIAVDASITHMYAPGTRRHIQSALKLGATVGEIMEVLEICVSLGMQASNLAPMLADELERFGWNGSSSFRMHEEEPGPDFMSAMKLSKSSIR
jgi:hypothetical protein